MAGRLVIPAETLQKLLLASLPAAVTLLPPSHSSPNPYAGDM
jgi:hypothetical protein